ncbi:MAG: cell division protein FtsQ/DivIB [Candidatus Omnitrophica bacterium]|nr:cell division protein FtsQ/DivIB [Candidatus Omnitrophota bacterium]
MRKNKNKSSQGTGFKKARAMALKVLGAALLILLALSFIIGYIWKSFIVSDYFKIKDIVTRDADTTMDLSYLKGKNIFDIDISYHAQHILRSCPSCSDVKLIRVFPNRLFVDFQRRRPLAIVKLNKDFVIDENGVIFYSLNQQSSNEDLPQLFGLEKKLSASMVGKRSSVRELWLALNIIKEMSRNNVLKDYKIKKIDVSNPANTSIFIRLSPKIPDYPDVKVVLVNDILEVKIGADNIKDKLVILAGVFLEGKQDLAGMSYVDLRFKKPVIKLNNDK